MSELLFCPLDETTFGLYCTWFQDTELKRRIEPPTQQWLNYVRNMPGIYAWIIYEGNIPVGQLQLDTYADHTGSVGLVVNPTLRNQGNGKKILKAFLKRAEVTRLAQLEVTIEPDNEGFLHFTYNPVKSQQLG